MAPPVTYLRIEDLEASYGAQRVLAGVSFEVAAGERLCLLGPSGCGKTTTLQAIAGFVAPERGRILVEGRDIAPLAPETRNIGVMFQNYALFSHLSIFDNVAFGLKMRRLPQAEIRRRVGEALDLVQLAHAGPKRPSELSGGEQQRIAFARAVVIQPTLLLLDEPFSNLDARLRQAMRIELLALLQTLRIATIMVTHDQEEAMAIADRIALMRAGRIEQIGTAAEVYDGPNTLFAAEFLGEANIYPVEVAGTEGGCARLDVPGLGPIVSRNPSRTPEKGRAVALVRPQNIAVHPVDDAIRSDEPNRVEAEIEQVLFLGHRTEYHARVGGLRIVAWRQTPLASPVQVGDRVAFAWRGEDTLVLQQSGQAHD